MTKPNYFPASRRHEIGVDCRLVPKGQPIPGTGPRNPAISHITPLCPIAPTASRPPEPTVPELAANFTLAMAGWAAKGFPIISPDQKAIRDQICDDCEHWDPKAYAGWGRCKVCGCGKVKRLLATQSCPKGKWPPLTPPTNPV